MTTISFFVPGKPIGKGRPRFYRRGPGVGTYTDKRTVNFEDSIAYHYYMRCREIGMEKAHLFGGPVEILVTADFRKPKSWPKKLRGPSRTPHLSLPDADNIGKAILDGLNGIAFEDDRVVFRQVFEKWWAGDDDPEGIDVILKEWEDPDVQR